MTRADLERLVATSDEQRFALDAEHRRVRANQGHTVEVELGLTAQRPPDVLFHGTPRRYLEAILATRLDKRARHAVHLSPDIETAARVGARRGAHVVLRVDAARACADRHGFACSANGVWLTDRVPPAYLAVD
jgi:putative RNA 2'-phosphotransferase